MPGVRHSLKKKKNYNRFEGIPFEIIDNRSGVIQWYFIKCNSNHLKVTTTRHILKV